MHYSVFGGDYINSTFLVAAMFCAIIYFVTWTIVPNKPKAKFQIVGVLAAAILLGPWWCALLGGLVGHIAGIYFVDRWNTGKPGEKKYLGFVGILLVIQTVAGAWTTTNVLAELDELKAVGRAERWETIRNSGEVGRFLSANFQPCEKQRPEECRSKALELAEKTSGLDFASKVDLEIGKIIKQPEMSEAAAKKVSDLRNQYFVPK